MVNFQVLTAKQHNIDKKTFAFWNYCPFRRKTLAFYCFENLEEFLQDKKQRKIVNENICLGVAQSFIRTYKL